MYYKHFSGVKLLLVLGRVILYTGNFGEVFNLEGSLLFSLAGWVKRSWFQYPNTQCMVYLSTLTITIGQMQIIIYVLYHTLEWLENT